MAFLFHGTAKRCFDHLAECQTPGGRVLFGLGEQRVWNLDRDLHVRWLTSSAFLHYVYISNYLEDEQCWILSTLTVARPVVPALRISTDLYVLPCPEFTCKRCYDSKAGMHPDLVPRLGERSSYFFRIGFGCGRTILHVRVPRVLRDCQCGRPCMPALADSFARLVTIGILQKFTVATAAKDSSDSNDLAPIEVEIGEHFAHSNRPIGGAQRGSSCHYDRDGCKVAKAE